MVHVLVITVTIQVLNIHHRQTTLRDNNQILLRRIDKQFDKNCFNFVQMLNPTNSWSMRQQPIPAPSHRCPDVKPN